MGTETNCWHWPVALCLCLSILPGAAWETTSGTIGESHVSWSVDESLRAADHLRQRRVRGV